MNWIYNRRENKSEVVGKYKEPPKTVAPISGSKKAEGEEKEANSVGKRRRSGGREGGGSAQEELSKYFIFDSTSEEDASAGHKKRGPGAYATSGDAYVGKKVVKNFSGVPYWGQVFIYT